ncbi:MAG: hypothetical protein HOW73_25945 [Polyangiaceae bacterium]|nr:hypothetical protein [Polyangiaceae bacterium]
MLAAACVPEGPPTEGSVTLPEQTIVVEAGGDTIKGVFFDDFDREEIGEDYEVLSDAWSISEGWLCAQGARNRGAWLTKRLPPSVRIEFDAMALSDDGDIKVEVFGDGASGATGASYDDATGYIAIFGGWRNTLHAIARLDEHGDNRRTLAVDPASDDPVSQPVRAGQPYHFKLERRLSASPSRGEGTKLVMSVNGQVVLDFVDPEPLDGAGHDHFGFNEWTAPVCFDNLEIAPL